MRMSMDCANGPGRLLGEIPVKKLLLLAAAALLAGACSETMPSGPRQVAPADKASLDLFCASGYVVAYDENGNPYCAPEQDDPGARPGSRGAQRP